MKKDRNNVEVKDGLAITEPTHWTEAIDLVRRNKLLGLRIRDDYLSKKPGPPNIDFSLLSKVSFLESLEISPSLPFKRIADFDGIYNLFELKKLAISAYKKLDLLRFHHLEHLFVTDSPGLENFDKLTRLRFARIWKLCWEDLSFLAGMPALSELQLIQLPHPRIHGLDLSPSLSILDISHCRKLESIGAPPKCLTKLKLKKCPNLHNLSFLADHPSLEFLYAEVIQSIGFVPSLPQLSYIGFENVVDGDLQPLFESMSIKSVGLSNKKHYSPPAAKIKKAFPVRRK